MEQHTQDYIDNLFSSFEQNRKTNEIKEEIKSNLQEKIDDLTKKGITFTNAFATATSDLGTVEDIKEAFGLKDKQSGIKKYLLEMILVISFSAVYITLSLIFQIWNPLWIIYLAMILVIVTKHGGPGASILFSIGVYFILGFLYSYWFEALAIFGLSFSLIAYKDEPIAGIWLFLITAYLSLSSIFGLWHPMWLIFVLGLALTVLIAEKSIVGATWLLSIGLYLFFGFVFQLWAIMWILFIFSATITVIVEMKKESIT
jgi:hypothetical protein